VLYSSEDHLKTGTRDLDHPVLDSVENTDNWSARNGDLQRTFPLEVLMVPLSAITVAANSERLTCGGFSLGEPIRLENFLFIVD
jgi:hypothetical protein